MAWSLTQQRVHKDIEIIGGAGLALPTLCAELDDSIQRALPHAGAVYTVIDPDIGLPTIAYKFGGIAGDNALDADVGGFEGDNGDRPDPTSLRTLLAAGIPAIRVSAVPAPGSPRFRLLARTHGFADELRLVATVSKRTWGMVALFRDGSTFTDDDVRFAGHLSAAIGSGIRVGVLRGSMTVQPPHLRTPGVMVVAPDGTEVARSRAAETWLAEIDDESPASGWSGMVATLVARAREAARAGDRGDIACRVPTRSGAWAVVRASALAPGDWVAVAIAEATPRDTIPLVAEALAFTPRERDVVALVLRGADTRLIGKRLGLSVHTVQDHLRSVFEKAGVHSRTELIGKLLAYRATDIDPPAVEIGEPGWAGKGP